MRLGSMLVGGVIGAGLAMLLAPRTGSETQAQLKRRAQALKDQYGDVVEQGRVRATELIRTGRERLDERLQQGTETIERLGETAERRTETPPTATTTPTTDQAQM